MLRFFIICTAISCLCDSLVASETWQFDFPGGTNRTIRFALLLGENAGTSRFEIQKAHALELHPDKKGIAMIGRPFQWNEAAATWNAGRDERLIFWPAEGQRDALEILKDIPPQSWRNRPLAGVFRYEQGALRLWIEGRLLFNRPWPEGGHVTLRPGRDTVVRMGENMEESGEARFAMAEIAHLLDDTEAAPERIEVEGVPFEVREGAFLPLAEAGWPDWKKDPGDFYEDYDGGPWFIGHRGLPLFQAPREDYVAAYLLACAEEASETGNEVTLRAGRRIGGHFDYSQVLMHDFAGTVPRGKGGERLHVVRIPFTEAFAQDIAGDVLDIEVTKELRLARRSPDPCRFRWRPLGLPSGVKIAGISLERSPLQFELKAGTEGSLFEAPERPNFTARLTNITDAEENFRLEVIVDGKRAHTLEGAVAAGKTAEKRIELPEQPLGHHTLEVVLHNAKGKLFSRNVFFGCLPADARKYREESPFGGTFRGNGDHFTPQGDDLRRVGPIYRKLGLRYGMYQTTPEIRETYGIRQGFELAIQGLVSADEALAKYETMRRKHPDLLPEVLLFHEDGIGGGHGTRVPDLFHDRPPYQLGEKDRERFEAMVRTATEAAKAIRAKYPEVKFSLGNGGMPLREEFYRNGFPREFFDYAGNESPNFARPPETQPPDMIANNASLWMDRQMLDAYGYGEKQLYQCWEITYPGTNPGNLSFQTQADYYVRHMLHSLSWGIPRIRSGSLVEVGNTYHFGNWGASSLFTSHPRIEPKPAAIAVATLGSALDGASYDGFIETGSESAYMLRFQKKDASLVLPHWVVRGTRDFHVKLEGGLPQTLRLTAGNGAFREVAVRDGTATFAVSPTPGFLELPAGVTVADVSLGRPEHSAKPDGAVSELAPLASLDDWEVVEKRSAELETYNPLTPRRKGDFAFEPVEEFEGEGPALRVTPRPLRTGKATMPMVVELKHRKGIQLPGKPTEIGLRINGNSAWGRIIFELEDASGQRWISIGAKTTGASRWMADWLPQDVLADYKPGEVADWNTDDQFGLSRINFDGWRYVGFPLPGQYPGEGYHWPANSQWKSTGDGIVHYPLRLTKLIVELPEKTLHLNRYEPARRPEIYLRNLVSAENPEIDAPKDTPGGYVEKAQHDLR